MTALADLLRLVSDSPEDIATWMLLSDWMQQRGDPRGELIALDLALETAEATRRDALAGRRAELLAVHGPGLLGTIFAKLVAEGYGTIVWRRGFVDELSYVGAPRLYQHHRAVGWVVRIMHDQPEPFRFTRMISFARTDLADVRPFTRFAHLERLDISGTRVTDLSPLATVPRLRGVNATSCDLKKGTIDALREARPDVVVLFR